MPIRTAISELNLAREEGLIADYAIGGAVAAATYIEPSSTVDIDVFVVFPSDAHPLAPLSPLLQFPATLSPGDMRRFDWRSIRAAKEHQRQKLASLPLSQKLAILEQLREREMLLRPLRPSTSLTRETGSGLHSVSGPQSSLPGGTVQPISQAATPLRSGVDPAIAMAIVDGTHEQMMSSLAVTIAGVPETSNRSAGVGDVPGTPKAVRNP